jgi:hypothetical protein
MLRRSLLVASGITALLLAVELVYRALLPVSDVAEGNLASSVIREPVLGSRLQPNRVIKTAKIREGKAIYRAVYSIDRYSRRITPGQERGAAKERLLFFGCSFVFGHGVLDDQTLPYYVSRLLPTHRVYNYGSNGYGPQNMLARLRQTPIVSEAKGPGKATGVYVFIDSHVHRAVGSLAITGSWGGGLPYYFLGEDGKLVRKGDFKKGRRWLTAFYSLVAASGAARYHGIDLPPIRDRHLRLTASIIKESSDEFKAKFGGRFLVVFFPGNSKRYKERLLPLLKGADVEVLDYGDLELRKSVGPDSYLEDGHPGPAAYEALARLLARDVRLL